MAIISTYAGNQNPVQPCILVVESGPSLSIYIKSLNSGIVEEEYLVIIMG